MSEWGLFLLGCLNAGANFTRSIQYTELLRLHILPTLGKRPLNVGSSASAFELLTRFDTGQRCQALKLLFVAGNTAPNSRTIVGTKFGHTHSSGANSFRDDETGTGRTNSAPRDYHPV